MSHASPDHAPRRPGIEKLLAEIQRRNPTWSMDRARAEAKCQWHARNPKTPGQKGGAA